MAMNARIVGNGEITLVLSHGFGASQEIWEYVIPELSRRYKLLLFDWSFASAADSQPAATDFSYAGLANGLISLLDEMKMKGVVFVGHSLAGMVGCLASVDQPELFSHLVLVAASPRYMNSEEYQGGFEPSKIQDMLSSIEADFQSWADSFATSVLGKNYCNPLWKYLATLKAMNTKTALAVAKMAFLVDQRPLIEGKLLNPDTVRSLCSEVNQVQSRHPVPSDTEYGTECTARYRVTQRIFIRLCTEFRVRTE